MFAIRRLRRIAGVAPALLGVVAWLLAASSAAFASPLAPHSTTQHQAVRVAPAPPASPFVTSVIAEGLGLLVSWNPDPAAGSAADQVTSYRVTAVAAQGGPNPPTGCAGPFGISVTGSNSAALLPGLCAGVAYQASVAAVSVGGTSPPSPPASPVVPLVAQVPQAPLIVSVFGRPGALIVSWTPPGVNGGRPVTGYKLTASAKGKKTMTATAKATVTGATIKGLTDGTAYSVTIAASNSVGPSATSTGTGTPAPPHAPAGPTQVSASPDGTGLVTVSWSAPADDGGDSLTGYVVTWQQVVPAAKGTGFVPAPGSKPNRLPAPPGSSSVTLKKSQFSPADALYSVTVAAKNAAGLGAAVATASPVSPVTSIAAHTVVLSATTMAALASDTPAPNGSGSVLVWPNPPPAQVGTLTVGQVLVASPSPAAPNGLLDRVAFIGGDGHGNVAITTAPAKLNDVFTSLAVASTSDPLTDNAHSGAVLAKGDDPLSTPAFGHAAARFVPATAGIMDLGPEVPAIGFQTLLKLFFHYEAGDSKAGMTVDGELDLNPSLSLTLNLDQGFLGVPDGVSVSAAASVRVSSRLDVEAHFRYTKQLGEIDGAPITIPIGPVPLVIVPKVPIIFTADGQLGLRLEASVTIGGSVSWDSQHPDKLTTSNTSVPLKVTAGPLPGKTYNGHLAADLAVQPQLDIYDVGGPNVEGDAIVSADVNFTPPPGGAYLKITPSLKLSVGLNLNLFGAQKSFELPLLTQDFPPFVILRPPGPALVISPDSAEVQPGHTTQFTATRTDGKTGHPVTWTLSGAVGDKISDTGLFTASGPAERTVTVTATDKTGATGQTTVTVGVPFDAVGKLAVNQNYNTLTAQLSWNPPDSIGGATLKDYVVTGTGGVPTQLTTGPEVNVTNLRPGTTYTFTVYPVNTAGYTGPAASVTLRAVPLCSDTFTAKATGNPSGWSAKANWSSGAVPTSTDWVCTDGHSVVLPTRSVTVEGFSQPWGTVTVPSGGALTTTNSLVLGGTLAGPGTVTIPAGAIAMLTNSSAYTSGVRLVNAGTMEVRGGSKCFSGGSVLDNSGMVNLDDEAGLQPCSGSSGTVINEASGTISYEAPTGGRGSVIGLPMTDNGAVESDSGTLTLASVTGTGAPDLSGSGTIVLDGTSALPASTTMSGLTGFEVDTLSTLDLPKSLTLDAAQVTVSGTMSGPGTATVAAGSTATLTGTFALAGGLRLVNDGSMEIQGRCGCGGSQSFAGGAVLDNSGTLRLDYEANPNLASGGSGKFVNDASGTVSYNDSRPFSNATIGVPFTDEGAMNITGGSVTVNSALTLSGKTLTIGITGKNQVGQLIVSGPVTLDGALAIRTDDKYRPIAGTKVTIIAATTRSGKFAKVTGTQLPSITWNLSYLASTVTLKAVAG